jgi:apolipoprotein N-acyltransferase
MCCWLKSCRSNRLKRSDCVNSRLGSIPAPLIALIAGALNVLAFAPFGIWPLQIACLAQMFWLVLRESSIKRSAIIGWAYGFGWSVCGVYWLFISMHHYGHMPAWLAALAVGLLALLLGAFAALAMSSAAWLRRRWSIPIGVMQLLIFPSAWMLSEWLRGWVFTGFPWIVSGYAHNVSPLAGYAPIIGVYGIGWLAALIAGCLLFPSKKIPIGLTALILIGGLALGAVDWTTTKGQPISVRLLQGNVAQDVKFEFEHANHSLALYSDLIRAAPADLIATPETAIPMLSSQLPPDYLKLLATFAQQSNSHLIIGLAMADGPRHYANSVLGLTPNADANPYRYDKHHLVPFGEFIPFGFRWFVDMMQIPLGDFTPGAAVQAPFAVKDQWILPNICYEDLFGEEIAGQLAASHSSGAPQATILLNVSNIAWYDDSLALPQHLQISQMRALETGRPMLRATNTGTTAVIDQKGKVVARLPQLASGVLTASVQGYQGMTPYIRAGNSLMLALALAMLGLGWLLSGKNRMNSPSTSKTR